MWLTMEKNLEEDIISKIYYNELEAVQELPNTIEYVKLTEKLKNIEKSLLKDANKEDFKKYMEYINERSSMESENQFKLGFKLGIRIILEALK